MKPTTSRAVAFLASALAGVGLAASEPAFAIDWFTRSSAAACLPVGGEVAYGDFAVQNNSATSPLLLLCAADDSETHPKHNTTQLHVHGYDGSANAKLTAQACESFWFIGGGACDTVADNGGVAAVGQVNNHLDFDAVWNTDPLEDGEHNFGYLVVSLPANDGVVPSSLRGVYQAGDN